MLTVLGVGSAGPCSVMSIEFFNVISVGPGNVISVGAGSVTSVGPGIVTSVGAGSVISIWSGSDSSDTQDGSNEAGRLSWTVLCCFIIANSQKFRNYGHKQVLLRNEDPHTNIFIMTFITQLYLCIKNQVNIILKSVNL